ncbi:MAG: hypothetical protein JNM69_29905 [Archangium sp.]|nr:hypothetical protein [Archangium sp.]
MTLSLVLLAEPADPQAAAWVNVAAAPFLIQTFALSLGASVPVAPRVALTTDAAWIGRKHLIWDECASGGWVGWLSVGPEIRPFGAPNRRDGFYLLPKFVMRLSWTVGSQSSRRTDGDYCPAPYPNGLSFAAGVGGTLGWNWVVWNHLYLGVGGGAAIVAALSKTFTGVVGLWEIDVQLRVGVAF